MFQIEGAAKAVVFKPNSDILKIVSHLNLADNNSKSALHAHLVAPADLTKVQNLVLGIKILEHNFEGAMEDIKCMTSLETIEIQGSGHATVPFKLEIDFRDAYGDGQEIKPVYIHPSLGLLTGVEAIFELGGYVDTHSEQDRLYGLWTLLERAYATSRTIPKVIHVKIQYAPEHK
jgi:hypothetical protein